MTDVISLPHHPQSAQGFCLAACARMVLAYWGEAASEKDVVELLRIGTWGVPASAIKSLSQWGWNVDYGRGTRVDLAQWLRRGVPSLPLSVQAFWNLDTGKSGFSEPGRRLTPKNADFYAPVCENLRESASYQK